jgi:hypothetical protein
MPVMTSPVGARLAREAFGVLEDAFAGKPRSYKVVCCVS